MRIHRDDNSGHRQRALPVIGHIRIGQKVQRGEKSIPTSLDHFVATGNYAGLFLKAYGEKPNLIQVVFPSDSTDIVCDERYEARDPKTGALTGKSDGQRFELWDGTQWIVVHDKSADLVRTVGKWRTVLTLRFVLPKIRHVFGLWQLTTTAEKSSIPQVVQTFDSVLEAVGTVVNIPFDLSVEKVTSQLPGEKKVFPVLKLVPNLSYQHLDMLRSFVESGHSTRQLGVITEQKIEAAAADTGEHLTLPAPTLPDDNSENSSNIH